MRYTCRQEFVRPSQHHSISVPHTPLHQCITACCTQTGHLGPIPEVETRCIYSEAVGASVPPGAVAGAVANVGFPGRGTSVKRMLERGMGPPEELWALVGASLCCLKMEWE